MMGILHHTEPCYVTQRQIEEARIEIGAPAFENALAALDVPTGPCIRAGRARARKIRDRGTKKNEARCAGNSECDDGRETATAPAVAEACADGGSAA